MTFTVHNLVLCNYFIILGSMVSTWLAHKNLISKFTANRLRLISFVATLPVICLLIFNHINVYIPFFFNGSIVLSLCFVIVSFGLVYLNEKYYKSHCAGVLGATIISLPIYAALLLFEHNGVFLTKMPPLMSLFCTYFITTQVALGLGDDFFTLLQKVSVYLCKYYKGYKSLLQFLNNVTDKSHLILTLTCGLIFSLLNFLQVYQQSEMCFASYLTLFFLAFSILAYAVVGCGLIDSGRNVKYHYNFIFQMVLNYILNFKHIRDDIISDQIPKFSLLSFSTVILFTLVNTPIAYAMDPLLPMDSSSTMGMDSAQSTPRVGDPQPVGEGASTSKAAKTAFDASKLATEKLKPHVLDMSERVVETAKNKTADATVIGAGGVGLAAGYEQIFGTDSVPSTDHEPQSKNIASANAIVGDLKQANYDLSKTVEIQKKTIDELKQTAHDQAKAIDELKQTALDSKKPS